MFGFHFLDILVILLYFAGMIYIGIIVSRRIKNEEDFFMGGRNLGRILQTFMNFGMATSSETSVGAARETFRQGMAGIWIKLFVLFMTPFYWFTAVWTRRLRATSMGEIFRMRYANAPMEKVYAVKGMLSFMAMIAVSFVALQKTVEVITPLPESQLSAEQKTIIGNFKQMSALEKKMGATPLTDEEMETYEKLKALKTEGLVKSSFSAVNPKIFVPIIALIVMVYAIAGGLLAAAITDFIQGVLLLVLSFLLLPAGLFRIGGFTGLHEKVPESAFNLFGTAALSEYPWYYVVAISVMGMVMVEAAPHNCQIMGSAKDEESARVGRVFGNFMKRFTIILWGFTGVVGYGLYKHAVADPDMLWGHMTRELLAPGLIGLMVVCLVAALMSTADAFIVATGALFTRNLYEPLFPGRSQREYLLAGRVAGGIVLAGAITISLFFNDILRLVRFIWSIGLIFTPVYWMGIVWRRSNARGAWAAIIYTFVFTVIFSYFLGYVKPVARINFLTQTTEIKVVTKKTGATQSDVESGTAEFVGQTLQKEIQIPARGVFFENVVRENPDDPNSPLIGKNRFRTSLLIPAMLGVDLTKMTKGTLISLGYYLDVLIPFLFIIIISRFSKPCPRESLDRYYARLHTPVDPDPEKDREEVRKSEQNPERFRHRNLFPATEIMLQKPSRRDVLGFLAAWAAVGGVILTVIILASIGS
jgi:SSS family solute:Na+ symporter